MPNRTTPKTIIVNLQSPKRIFPYDVKKTVLFLVFLSFVLVGCERKVTIQEILDNPRNFEGKTVTVEGTVKELFSLFVIKYFTLTDDNGLEIHIVTERSLPKKGEKLRVRGKVEEGFSFGDQTFTVIMEEGRKRTPVGGEKQ
jgi:hypothetical protein